MDPEIPSQTNPRLIPPSATMAEGTSTATNQNSSPQNPRSNSVPFRRYPEEGSDPAALPNARHHPSAIAKPPPAVSIAHLRSIIASMNPDQLREALLDFVTPFPTPLPYIDIPSLFLPRSTNQGNFVEDEVDPLVISAKIGPRRLTHILVDTGSSSEILTLQAYRRMSLPRKYLRIPRLGSVHGLLGERFPIEGRIDLEVEVGDGPNKVKGRFNFTILDIPLGYDAIFGRTLLGAFDASISVKDLMIRFPTPTGEGGARGDGAFDYERLFRPRYTLKRPFFYTIKPQTQKG